VEEWSSHRGLLLASSGWGEPTGVRKRADQCVRPDWQGDRCFKAADHLNAVNGGRECPEKTEGSLSEGRSPEVVEGAHFLTQLRTSCLGGERTECASLMDSDIVIYGCERKREWQCCPVTE
jgi:hypothetical protein